MCYYLNIHFQSQRLIHVCSTYLEISDSAQLKKRSLHDLHTASYIAARPVNSNLFITQCISVCWVTCVKQAQCNVNSFCSHVCRTVYYRSLWLWKPIWRRNHMKIVFGNLEGGFLVFQFLRNQACLRVKGILFQYLCQHPVIYAVSCTLYDEI